MIKEELVKILERRWCQGVMFDDLADEIITLFVDAIKGLEFKAEN